MTETEQTYSEAAVRRIAYRAAGAGAAAVMEQVPDVVMPTEDIEYAVESILAEAFGHLEADWLRSQEDSRS